MYRKLLIFRGLPGSGKSTLAHRLAPMVVEMDQFRVNAGNRYRFDRDQNEEVHRKSVRLLRFCMNDLRMPLLAVSNTHIKVWNMLDYIELGRRYGYVIEVITCRNRWKSVHDVPDEVMTSMAEAFEELDAATASRLGISEVREYKGENDETGDKHDPVV